MRMVDINVYVPNTSEEICVRRRSDVRTEIPVRMELHVMVSPLHTNTEIL